MEWLQLETNNNVVKFSHQIKAKGFVLGGILRRGTLAWLAEDNTLQIVSLRNGQLICSHTFCPSVYNCDAIICVSEITSTDNVNDMLLAVCLDYIPNSSENTNIRSSIAIYSVKSGCVLSCLRIAGYINCMCFMPAKNCRRSLIQNFDGCLAVGTQDGIILLIDLYLNYLLSSYEEKLIKCLPTQVTTNDCHALDYNLPLAEIHRIYKKILCERSLQNVVHFGIQIEVVESPCSVESLLPIDLINGLAAGLEDGRLIIYDITEMQIFYASKEHESSPLIKLDFLEPPDDPRACFYILTLHANGKQVIASLYAFMYGKRFTDEQGHIYFDNFQNGSMKLEMLLDSSASMIISCQAITKPPKTTVDDGTCLFAVSWNSMSDEGNKLLIFDINQWYKEEMPRTLTDDRAKSCLATFKVSTQKFGLGAFLNPATISHFNSMQRCEEHFYPNSLSFDWLLLDAQSCRTYNWPGIQNKTLNDLRSSTASLFLEPDVMFEKIREARLLPQFTELNSNALFSQSAKCEVLLAVALENNCMGLLRDCARSWADGSFTGNNGILLSTGVELSLQTLTKWIWKHASEIKKRCNELCKGLLYCRSHSLDQREKKELGFLTKQLRNLADLLDETMNQSSKHMSENAKNGSLHLAADYQELLIWIINIGLLPEISQRFPNDDIPTTSNFASEVLSIYPYKQLRDYYVQRRSAFAKIDESSISKKSGSCRLIFIDAFIEHECMWHTSAADTRSGDNLREHWLQNYGNGLYPPANIESMLRIMLLSNVSYESKCAILFYFFLDLHVALTDGDHHDNEELKEIVENFLKFPSVFKLSPSLTKTLQAFWYLDHGNVVAAVDEFLSPFNSKRKTEQWLIELLVEALLLQNAAHLALRILDAYSSLISPSLKLSTLLSNNLVAEAFHFVRSKDDVELTKRFFTNCLKMGKLGVIRDLALNEKEGKLVENLLKRIQLPGAKNLHFVYLLQKSKYIEAVSYMDELSHAKSIHYNSNNEPNSIDAPNLVISAFNTTMAPVTQTLTDVYFRIKNKIKQKETQNRSPVPLSCQLIKQNANNLLGGIYHSSALSAHFATCYYDEELQCGRSNIQHENRADVSPLSANNVPFLRKPQTEICRETIGTMDRQTVYYPQEFKLSEKRRIAEVQQEDSVDAVGTEGVQHLKQPEQANKKRRLLGEEFFTGLKQFQQKNIVLNDTGLNLTEPVANEANEHFLKQPLTAIQLSKGLRRGDNSESTFIKKSVSNELHGILKFNTPEPTELKTRNTEASGAEEKILRFMLPSREDKSESCVAEDLNLEDAVEVQLPVETHTTSEGSVLEDGNITKYYSTLSTHDQEYLPTTRSVKDSGISDSSKLIESQEPSISRYESARSKSLSYNVSGPQQRRALSRMSAEPEKCQKDLLVTETLNKSNQIPQTYAKEISSGLGESLSKVIKDPKAVSSIKSSLFKITSVTTLSSVEFTPQICSSKVGESHKKLPHEQKKISEQSTIIMTSTSECDITEGIKPESVTAFIKPRPPLSSINEQVIGDNDKPTVPSLDTTLGMSSCDIIDFDMTTVGNVDEEKPGNDLEVFETVLDDESRESEKEKMQEMEEDIEESEENDSPGEIIELLSSSDESDNDSSENEIVMELETGDESLISEIESEDSSNDIDNSHSDQETYDSNETDQNVEHDPDKMSSSSDTNDIVLQQEDSSSSNEDDDTGTNISKDSKIEKVSEVEQTAPLIKGLQESTSKETERMSPVIKVSEVEQTAPLIKGLQESTSKETERMSPVSEFAGASFSEKLVEKLVDKLPQPTSSSEVSEYKIVEIPQKTKKILVLLENSKEDKNTETQTQKTIVETEHTNKDVSPKPLDMPASLPDDSKDEKLAINPKKIEAKPQEMNVLFVENLNQTLLEELPKKMSTECMGKTVLQSSEKLEKENFEEDDSSLQQSSTKDEVLLSIEKDENGIERKKNDISELSTSFVKQKDSEKETSEADLEMSDHFETPNTSIHSIKQTDKTILNVNSAAEESPKIQIFEESGSKNSIKDVNLSPLRSAKTRKRGQSMPPQPLLINDENLETDSLTPKRRSKRGISVPPQTIEVLSLTPNTRKRRDSSTSLRRKTINADPESPQSPSSSRSGRDSQLKRSLLESGETPLIDSPAMRTRSRLRTISENSDTTVASLNSPSVSGKRPRRLSISSTVSEQQQQLLTPKRTRRSSLSGRSDTEGTPHTRRLLTKEVEEESQNTEAPPSTESGIDIYSNSRRLTRTQRALLEKSEQASQLSDSLKDDQASVSSRVSQTSTRSKHQTSRGTSVRSNQDDGDDDRASISSSVASETRRSSRRLRAQQQQHSPNANLSSIPEDDVIEGADTRSKRNKNAKK